VQFLASYVVFSFTVTVTATSPPSPLDGETTHQSGPDTDHGLFANKAIVVLFPADGAEIEACEIVKTGASSFEHEMKNKGRMTKSKNSFFMLIHTISTPEMVFVFKRKCGVDRL
jgi:hypothetical protein